MAISPPSDLVLDVVRAADPADVQAAQAKLQANRAAFAANSLAEAGNGFESSVDALKRASSHAGLGNVHDRADKTDKTDKVPQAYHKFEAMVLQNFVQNMLPKSDQLYGKGSSGEIYKGMMAEQIGNVMAKDGGVGIAEKMYQQQLQKMRGTGADNAKTDAGTHSMALSMITDFERKSMAKRAADSDSTPITGANATTAKAS